MVHLHSLTLFYFSFWEICLNIYGRQNSTKWSTLCILYNKHVLLIAETANPNETTMAPEECEDEDLTQDPDSMTGKSRKCDRGVRKCDRWVRECDKWVWKCDSLVWKCDSWVWKCDRWVRQCDRGVSKCGRGVSKCGRGIRKCGRGDQKVWQGSK